MLCGIYWAAGCADIFDMIHTPCHLCNERTQHRLSRHLINNVRQYYHRITLKVCHNLLDAIT